MWTPMNSAVSNSSAFTSYDKNNNLSNNDMALPSVVGLPALKCSLPFSQNQERSLLDVVMWLHVKKPHRLRD